MPMSKKVRERLDASFALLERKGYLPKVDMKALYHAAHNTVLTGPPATPGSPRQMYTRSDKIKALSRG